MQGRFGRSIRMNFSSNKGIASFIELTNEVRKQLPPTCSSRPIHAVPSFRVGQFRNGCFYENRFSRIRWAPQQPARALLNRNTQCPQLFATTDKSFGLDGSRHSKYLPLPTCESLRARATLVDVLDDFDH